MYVNRWGQDSSTISVGTNSHFYYETVSIGGSNYGDAEQLNWFSDPYLNADKISFPANKCLADGGAMDLNNSDIVGVNNIVFNDESGVEEGLYFLKQGATPGSLDTADYETLRGYRSKLYYNDQNIALLVYPVGAIYMSVVNTSPATLFGGTWSVWGTGRVAVGVDTSQKEFNTVEKTGGTKTHTLTISQMPAHTHTIPKYNWNVATGSTSVEAHYANVETENSGSTGGGKAHNNLQPYITCYMWKRTA